MSSPNQLQRHNSVAIGPDDVSAFSPLQKICISQASSGENNKMGKEVFATFQRYIIYINCGISMKAVSVIVFA